jgi:hypothetical protein
MVFPLKRVALEDLGRTVEVEPASLVAAFALVGIPDKAVELTSPALD